MKEYDIDYGSFIGGWYIPEEICDNLIELFHTEKDHWIDGSNYWGNEKKPDWKRSTDVELDLDHSEMRDYVYHLNTALRSYKERYPYCDSVHSYNILDPIKIQHYKPGEGFYNWHMENSGHDVVLHRHLVYMTYLNTLDNAGTEFFHQKTTTPCHKGLTVIWPAAWTHTHKGVTNHDSDKYIVTGWWKFHDNQ